MHTHLTEYDSTLYLMADINTSTVLTQLSAIDLNKYASLMHPRRRYQFLAGRALLAQVLALKPDHSLEIAYNASGKPFFAHNGAVFSLSHSAARVALLMSAAGEVGVDIEQVCTDRPLTAIAYKMFPQSLAQYIEQQSNKDKQYSVFYRQWCMREAWFKMLGIGIAPERCRAIRFASSNAAYAQLWCAVDQDSYIAVAFDRPRQAPNCTHHLVWQAYDRMSLHT